MTKYHFITFATPEFISYAEENVKSALEVGKFDTSTIYTMDDIDEYFKVKNAHLFKHNRLAGYCIWKPYIIFKKLLEIDENDILCYNDSRYIWRTDVKNMENQILKNKNIGLYANKPNSSFHIEKNYTKGDAFLLMNIPNGKIRDVFKNTIQVWAGFVLLRKKFNPLRFIGEWLTYSQDYRIITDSETVFEPNDETFIENRHDQTILSLLSKKWGLELHTLDKNWMIDIRNPI